MNAREKFYIEKLPVEERTAAIPLRFGQKQLLSISEEFAVEDLKEFLFINGYPKRPLPKTLSLTLGEDIFYRGNPDYDQREDGYELIWELTFTDGMNMEGEHAGWNRMWWHDNAQETIQEAKKLAECIPEIVALIEAK